MLEDEPARGEISVEDSDAAERADLQRRADERIDRLARAPDARVQVRVRGDAREHRHSVRHRAAVEVDGVNVTIRIRAIESDDLADIEALLDGLPGVTFATVSS